MLFLLLLLFLLKKNLTGPKNKKNGETYLPEQKRKQTNKQKKTTTKTTTKTTKYRQKNRQADRQTDRQADRQADRQTDRQTDRHRTVFPGLPRQGETRTINEQLWVCVVWTKRIVSIS